MTDSEITLEMYKKHFANDNRGTFIDYDEDGWHLLDGFYDTEDLRLLLWISQQPEEIRAKVR